MLRTLLLIVVVAVVVYLGTSYYHTGHLPASWHPPHVAVGTSGHDDSGPVDVAKARERGAEIGESVGKAADKAGQFVSDAALTAKVKSKIALDDTIKGSDIHVETDHGVVTLTGSADSPLQRQRAVLLARETAGVKSVRDQVATR